jgi:hypothetical protein
MFPDGHSETMTVSIDAGHVRTARGHQGRTFEVMAAQVSNDDGKPVLFSGVPGEADQQHAQLNSVLSGLGMLADTEVTILSDGADGPRSLGQAASTGIVFHVLDWFHLAMRVQHAAQCASGWPNATVRGRRDGARFADAVEHIRWRLWHGQTGRALSLIQRTLTAVKAKADGKNAAARSAAKLTKAMIALETYVSGLADLIIDCASARLGDEPFSTSPTEGAVQWLLHRRMAAKQQMRWSPRGAHLLLQVRTAIVNRTFDADHRDICRRRCSFRMAAWSPPCLGRSRSRWLTGFVLPPGLRRSRRGQRPHHATIAVYASCPPSPAGHATLATGRVLALTRTGLPPAGSNQLILTHPPDLGRAHGCDSLSSPIWNLIRY